MNRNPKSIMTQKKTLLIKTKGICLLCLRSCSNRNPISQSHLNFSSRFCKLISRYLKFDHLRELTTPLPDSANLKNVIHDVAVELCEDCSALGKQFCEFYTELEVMKMKLNSCVKTFSNIMTVAGRIPSRVKNYSKKMSAASRSGSSEIRNGGIVASSKPLADKFRKELIKKCLQSTRIISPRVNLPKLKGVEFNNMSLPFAVLNKQAKPNNMYVITQKVKHCLIGYLIFYWITIILQQKSNKRIENALQAAQVPESPDEYLLPVEHAPIVTFDNSSILEDFVQTDTINSSSQISRNLITITDSGKTVLLPHRIKVEALEFVDESIGDDDMMNEYEVEMPDNQEFPSITVVLDNNEEPILQESPVSDDERTCLECRLELNSRAELEKHRVFIHKAERFVKCPQCKLMFPSYHFLKCHRNVSTECSLDEPAEKLEFETIAKPIFPFAQLIRGNRFCPMQGCFEVFYTNESLKLHLKAHGSFKCNFCNMTFEKAHDLALHEIKHSESSSLSSGFKCSRCNFHIGSQFPFILHFLKVHLNISVYKETCRVCQKGFAANDRNVKAAMSLHFKTHHEVTGKAPESIFKCGLCDAPFLKKLQLSMHEMSVHNIKRNNSACKLGVEVSGGISASKRRMSVHGNIGQPDGNDVPTKRSKTNTIWPKKHHCHCGKSYTTRTNLKIHMKKFHENEDRSHNKEENEEDDDLTDENEEESSDVNDVSVSTDVNDEGMSIEVDIESMSMYGHDGSIGEDENDESYCVEVNDSISVEANENDDSIRMVVEVNEDEDNDMVENDNLSEFPTEESCGEANDSDN